MVKDPGGTLSKARQIDLTAITKSFKNAISRTDKLDLYCFKTGDRSRLNLTLNELKANANLALLDQKGQIVLQSKRPGRKAETIEALLEPGTYYIRISQKGKASTRYQLLTSSAPIPNTDPTVTTNGGLTLTRGAIAPVTTNLLQVTDVEQRAEELLYTLTERPQNGRVYLDGQVLKVGSTFTQADIDSGRLSYQSIGKVQLTNNSTYDSAPWIDGSRMVWTGSDGNDFEIFLYDYLSDTTTPITNNATLDQSARISGDYIVWDGHDGQDSEIMLHNLKTGVTTPITNNDQIQDRLLVTSGNNIVWSAYNEETFSYTLMLYDGGTGKTVALDHDGFMASPIGVSISDNKVAWITFKEVVNHPDDALEEVLFYDGATTRQLTDNVWFESTPRVTNNGVVWMGFDGQDHEIYRLDGNTTHPLTNNTFSDAEVAVFGNTIAWIGVTNGQSDVFLSDGQTTTQLTQTPISEYGIRLSDSAIVWESDPTFMTSSIFFYDGVTVTQLVDSGLRNGLRNLSGNTVGWANIVGDDLDAFFYNGARSDRFSFSVSDGVGNVVNSSFNITIT